MHFKFDKGELINLDSGQSTYIYLIQYIETCNEINGCFVYSSKKLGCDNCESFPKWDGDSTQN